MNKGRYYRITYNGKLLMEVWAHSAREAKEKAQRDYIHRWREMSLPLIQAVDATPPAP